jgi:hypothetical protein
MLMLPKSKLLKCEWVSKPMTGWVVKMRRITQGKMTIEIHETRSINPLDHLSLLTIQVMETIDIVLRSILVMNLVA